MIRFASTLLPFLAFAIAAPAVAAPATSGGGVGKVNVMDMHFRTKSDAAAKCGTSPVTATADGGYICSMPSSSDHAINEKHLGNQTKPAPKPQ
jgi:hypothetical protein